MAIVGYERIPDGVACELCELAAGQRYRSSDLMPIHDKCGCGVEPITEDDLLTPKKGVRGELRDAVELKNDEWVPVKGMVRGKVAKWNDDVVLMNAGTDAKPRWVQGTRLDLRKPTRAKAASKGPEIIDVAKLDPINPTLKGQALRDAMEQPRELFSLQQRQALKTYTGGNKGQFGNEGFAESVNRRMRNGTFGPKSMGADQVKNIDSAFDAVDGIPEPGLVFRGTKVKFGRSLKPGAIIEDPGYVSTSPSRSVAEKFRPWDGDILEITLPRGTKAIDINEASGSAYGSEREILLRRGSRFVVESIRPDPKHPNNRIVKVRLIL